MSNFITSSIAQILKVCCIALFTMTFSAYVQAVPLTHFVTNASGGFDAFVYPESATGVPSLVGGIFTLPQPVNPGYVIILDNSASISSNTASWDDVIHFFNSGSGGVTAMQFLAGGPNQASYFPSLTTVTNASHVFIVKSASSSMTTFTDYSVVGRQREVRNYHFFTAAFSVADGGPTVLLLGFALATLVLLARRNRDATTVRN